MDLNNKHTSTLIRKKWRKRKQFNCCGKGIPGNLTKPMRGNCYYCTKVKFFKNRDRIIMAKIEIMDDLKYINSLPA